MAREIIKENHPLNDTQIGQVYPLIAPITNRIFKKSSKAEKQSLLDEEAANQNRRRSTNKKQAAKPSENKDEDPFNFLGFGLVAYRDLILIMFGLFAVLTLLMVPAMVTYKSYNAIDPKDKTVGYSRMSLGNLGYSSTQCQMVPVDLGKIAMFCPYGTISTITYLGVNPGNMAERGVCSAVPANDECNKQVNSLFKDKLLGQMQNKNEGFYDYASSDLFTNYDALQTAGSTCVDKSAQLYVQYACAIAQEDLNQRHKDLSILACIAIFAASLYLIVLYFVKRNSKMNQLDWDIQTITPGDYTLQYEITEEAYHHFLNNVYYPGAYEERGISIGGCLKDYMKEHIEKLLTDKLREMRASGQDMSNIKIQEVKIADIVFAFNNAELIQLLKQRGNHIMY